MSKIAEKPTYRLDESSILEVWVIARYLGVNVDAIQEKYLDAEAKELMASITEKLGEVKKSQVKLPAGLTSYCKRKGISLEIQQ